LWPQAHEPTHQAFRKALAAWDGMYNPESRGALLFELLLAEVSLRLYGDDTSRMGAAASQWSYLKTFLMQDLYAISAQRREEIIKFSIRAAAKRSQDFKTWGDLHRIKLQHFLGGVPLLGRRFVLSDRPAPGSRETIMKSSHGLERGLHYSSYGSQARHVSDMSHPDLNYFVLLGGQDGFLRSENFADQLRLWEGGHFIKMPLMEESVQAEFGQTLILTPQQ